MWKLVLIRIWRRLKYVFRFRSLTWEYESCIDCGHCFRLNWSARDAVWFAVVGTKEGGSLCLDCFVERAEKKGFKLAPYDIEYLLFFSP